MTDLQPPCPYCGSPFTGPAGDVGVLDPSATVCVCHECGRDFAVAAGGCGSGGCGGGCSCDDRPDEGTD